MSRYQKKPFYWYFSFVPSIVMMIIIFQFSAKPATQSSEMSSGVVDQILHTVERIGGFTFEEEEFTQWREWIHTPIRKLAHMSEYAVFAMTVAFPLSLIWEYHGIKLILLGEMICFLYASTDEFHQVFVPGRSGEFRDVLIDSTGALFGLLLFSLVQKGYQKRKKHHNSRDKLGK